MTHTLSIIVPASNEEAYIADCLNALLASETTDARVEVLVVANACTDRTVEIARSFEERAESIGWTLRVLDLAQPGKLNALNVGDESAEGDLRLYLDADVRVSAPLVRMLVVALTSTDAARYASGTPRVSSSKSKVTRAYARFWQQLPFARSEAPGFGVFAVNASGRERWGRFPDIVSDDTYVRLLFSPLERVGVKATYEWPMVEGFGRLVKVRRRQDDGVREIARKWPSMLRNEGKPSLSAGVLVRLVANDPVGFMVYVAVAVAVRSKRPSSGWTRGR